MKRLGVLGGMGPAASAEFMMRLTARTPARRDQDHIPTILWSDPTVPDRSTSVRRGDDLPLPYLQAGIRGLVNCGCDHIVIPCNTAHFWFHELEKMDVAITHIVDSVADRLRELGVVNTTIAVMGTQGTIELGLYQYRLNKLGWNCVCPTTEEMNTLVQPAIDLIKANQIDQAYLLLIKVVDRLVASGVSAVVLGCTEIPLAVREEHWNGVPLVNSIDSLVSSVLRHFKRT